MTQAEQELFIHGSIWVRADFHLHTKADREFTFGGDEDHYVSSYVESLVMADIRIGVITNHNKFDVAEFEALRKTAKKKGIYLLPGVELSVGDGAAGIHTNIVFSESWLEGGDRITPFISTMFPGKTVEQYQNENGRSDKTVLQVVEELEKVGRAYFLVFAHVEDPKGLWTEFMGRLQDWRDKRYGDLRERTLGFQKVRTRDLREQVKRWLGAWYPAEVEGSDCKSIEGIGKSEACYLKIGAFNFEALQLALRDFMERVSSRPVAHRRSYLRSVQFEGGALNGQVLHLAPGLNTLIGIRGSGKSSILEGIRYCLDIPFGEKAQDADYKRKLIKHSLGSGGKVTVAAVDAFGQEYEIRRIWEHGPEVFVNGVQQPGVSIRETVISKPLYFGQKDLSSSGEGFEIDLVEKLLGPSVQDLRLRIEEQRELVRQAAGRYLKLGSIAERREDQARKKQDAEFKLERYKKYGIEDKLQRQMDFDNDARRLDEMLRSIRDFREDLEAFLAEHEDSLRNHLLYKTKQNEDFFESWFEVYNQAVAELDAVKAGSARMGNIVPLLDAKRSDFARILNDLKDEFAATERAIGEEFAAAGLAAIRTDEYRQLSKIIDQATAIISELDKEQGKADSVHAELLKALHELNELWHREFRSIEAEMAKVNANHSSLAIEVGFKEDDAAFKSYLQGTMKGSNLRESTYEKVVGAFKDPIEIFRDLPRLETLLGQSYPVFMKAFFENFELLLTYKVPNRFIITYKGKELKDHSLGQRASALILFILSQRDNDVILIDQPEDDLDNQTIYQDVIKLIRALKNDTQFIFATHNPNFPVLGDAEMVVSCSYSDKGAHFQPGSIDDKSLQERIVTIMEGGEEAFNRRKEIYGIWKPRNS